MFEPRVALASLSGESDADWARAVGAHVGAAFLGGVCVDEVSRDAARHMVADRDRTEFLPDDPLAFVDRELSKLDAAPLRAGFNVRSATAAPIGDAAAICREHDAILEVNAHCRQEELCAVGCGRTLLAETDRLCEYVQTAADAGAAVSVKVRAEVPGVDLAQTALRVARAGADAIHVDAMDSEPVIADVVAATGDDLFVIANNGVRDRETAREYFDHGADAVSVGRPSDRPAVLDRVREATDAWFREEVRV